MKHKRLLSIFLSIIIIGSSFYISSPQVYAQSLSRDLQEIFEKILDDREKRKENSHSESKDESKNEDASENLIDSIDSINSIINKNSTEIEKSKIFTDEQPSVEFCVEAKILKGNGSSLNLDGDLSRIEAAVLLIRLIGEEDAALALQNEKCPFSDAPEWAIGYANYAYKNNIIKGFQGKLNPHDKCTPNDFTTMLYRLLDMQEGIEFNWKNAASQLIPAEIINKTSKNDMKLYDDLIHSNQIKRCQAIALCYRALSRKYKELKDGKLNVMEETLADRLLINGKISLDLIEKYNITRIKTISYIHKANKKYRYYYQGQSYYEAEISGDNLILKASEPVFGEKIKVQVKNCNIEPGDYRSEYSLSPGDEVIWDAEIDNKSGVVISTEGKDYIYYKIGLEVNFNDSEYGDINRFLALQDGYIITKNNDKYFFRNKSAQILERKEISMKLYNNEVDKELVLKAFKEGIDKSKIDSEIIRKANEITQGISSEYDKVKAICRWISENIYYDFDYYHNKSQSTNSLPIDVLNNRVTVCDGYAELTEAMLTAIDIPNYYVVGQAIGMNGAESHAWNEAFVDGRWILIDNTFSSDNRYEDGQMIKGQLYNVLPFNTYFDRGIDHFFENHFTSAYMSGYIPNSFFSIDIRAGKQ